MRALRSIIYLVVGLIAFGLGALVPSHLRALDVSVVRLAGARGLTLINEGAKFAQDERPGPAELILLAARRAGVAGHEELARYLAEFKRARPEIARYGAAAAYLDPLFERGARAAGENEPRVLDLLLPDSARELTWRTLRPSTRGNVQEVLANRQLEATTVLPPVGTASGQALDTAIQLTALVIQSDLVSEALAVEIGSLAAAANRGRGTTPIESVYLDLLTLARAFNWAQFTAFIGLVDSVATLRELLQYGGKDLEHLAIVFTAAQVTGSGAPIAGYLRQYRQEGFGWLVLGMGAGNDGLRRVVREQRPLHASAWRGWLAERPGMRTLSDWLTRLALALPFLGLAFKYLLWFNAAFCAVRGVAVILPHQRNIEGPPLVAYQQQTLALLLVMFAVLFWEPRLAREMPDAPRPPGWNIPVLHAAVGSQINEAIKPIMTEINWIALVVFAVVQAALYALNVIKLREIRQQSAASDLKLRLLDNEEHMFDAGLYVGLGGTVLGLILPTFNVIQPSLMVAYASTLFGIIFVSLLKICHVRPYRRTLILDSTLGGL